MSINSFGRLLRCTTWGESHGPAIGVVVDGCPPGLVLAPAGIQVWLDKRRPGQSRFTTQRRESDRVEILSGVYEGRTTGMPISLLIANEDARPKDYAAQAGLYRPGHADFTYDAKYGFRDPRGGGRASARETASRVAAAAIARLIIPEVRIQAYLVELGGDAIDRAAIDMAAIDANMFACPDRAAALRWEGLIDEARREGDSLGAVAECVATGIPAGWGAPVAARLDADLAGALMSINAVKGVEIGAGFAAARQRGSQHNDPLDQGEPAPAFLSNHAGGVLGGISTGGPLVARVAFKPTPSIRTPMRTVNARGEAVEIGTKGRHDPCVGIRGTQVVAAMMALVLADHKLLHRGQCGRDR